MVYRVKANPKMIKWARIDAGYEFEDLPKTLKNTPKWESGELQPTWNDLRKLANKYKRPPAFYFRSNPPKKEEKEIIEFRSDKLIEKYTPDLLFEIKKAKYRRNAYINVHKDMNIPLHNFSKNKVKTENIKEFSKKIRDTLNISIETQKTWKEKKNGNPDYSHSNFLYHWKEVLSNLDILIFETEKVKEKEMSGVCLYYETCPIILLNGKNSPNRRIFTLIHELVHLMSGKSAICDVDKKNKKEAFCNKIASEFLVPSDELKRSKVTKKNTVNDHEDEKWTARQLGTLSHIYGVSKQTIIIKLYEINKTSNSFKNEMLSILENQNKISKEKKQAKQGKQSGGMAPVPKVKKYQGAHYSRVIITAYENEIIGPSTLKKYLGLPIDQIDLLYEEIF